MSAARKAQVFAECDPAAVAVAKSFFKKGVEL
jgi:hypothetical protein